MSAILKLSDKATIQLGRILDWFLTNGFLCRDITQAPHPKHEFRHYFRGDDYLILRVGLEDGSWTVWSELTTKSTVDGAMEQLDNWLKENERFQHGGN